MDILKKLKSGASKAADVAQQTVEFTKLAALLASKKRDFDKCMSDIGCEVYAARQAGDDTLASGKVEELCAAADSLQQEIAAIERQMKHLRGTRACACGKAVAFGAKFCPSCGRPMNQEQEPITIEAEGTKE